MPIYEFYCADCHRIFNFLSRTIDTRTRPACPRCGREQLERQVSAFAVSKGRPEPADDGEAFGGTDEARVEQVLAGLAREAEGVGDDDPRAMAHLMRRFYDRTGMPLGSGMEEALRRLEAGEDPDAIEDEMGDLLDGEEPPAGEGGRIATSLRRRLRPPARDDRLYEL